MKIKAAYEYTDGTNVKFFDVLYIEEDGTITLEHHNSQRTISWPARMEDGQFGQVVRYGKGSSIPFTDQKGNMRPRWSVLTAEQVAEISTPTTAPSHETTVSTAAHEGTTEGTPAASIPAAADAPEAAAPSPTPQPARKPRQRNAKAAQQPASSPVSRCTTDATDEDAPTVADDQPNDILATLRSIFVELLVTTVCTLIFWFSLSHASILGAAIAIGMLAVASRMGLTPIMTAAALEG